MYRKKEISSFPIIVDGLIYALVPIVLAVALYFVHWSLTLVFAGLALFVLFFFRNPTRIDKAGTGAILSPADGKVMSIGREDNEFVGQDSIAVTIFLSIFNVHVNVSPVKGEVVHQEYREGAMLPAFKSHAAENNEKNTIVIRTEDGKQYLVEQITGFIARRIVWWVKESSQLERGQKFGFIKFGSCTRLILPKDTEILVKEGQKVRGVKTLIGKEKK